MGIRTAAMLASIAVTACSSRPRPDPAKDAGGSAAVTVKPPVQVPLPSVKQYSAPSMHVDSPPIELPKQELFKLLDPGKGARQVLRYQLAPAIVTHTVETKLHSRHLDDKGAFSPVVDLPTLRDGFAITITKDRPGVLALRGLPGEIEGKSTPEAEQYQTAWRTLLQNRRATVAVDDRGQLGAIEFGDDPALARSLTAKDELAQRLLGMLVPVPAEAVAAGARWQVNTILRHGRIYAKQTATYTLTERTATRWKLHVKLLPTAEQQIVDDPAMPPGANAELLAMFRLLEGDLEVDPTRSLVSSGTLTVESRVHAKVQLPGSPAVEQLLEDTGSLGFTATP
jgi:hypothetical protein